MEPSEAKISRQKRYFVEQLLLRGDVLLQLDPRPDGVTVPESLRDSPALVLQIGLNMPVPIPDLEITDEGFSGTLSFNREPFVCRVPWSVVFGVVDTTGEGRVWPMSVPLELRDIAVPSEEVADLEVDEIPDAPPTPPRPRLGVVDGGLKGERPSTTPLPPSDRPHLRVVK